MFTAKVPDCSAKTLLGIIKEKVEAESIIISDCRHGYRHDELEAAGYTYP